VGLEEKRWEVARSGEFRDRVNETLRRLDDMLEIDFGYAEREGFEWERPW